MTDFTHTETGHSRKQWQILTACSFILCINAAFPIYGASVINTTMVSAMGAERSLLGLLVSVNMAITGLTAPLMGALVGRAGARFTLICGSILMIVGALTMATLVDSVLPAVLAFGIVFGLAMSVSGFVANQACVMRLVQERPRPPICHSLCNDGPWRLRRRAAHQWRDRHNRGLAHRLAGVCGSGRRGPGAVDVRRTGCPSCRWRPGVWPADRRDRHQRHQLRPGVDRDNVHHGGRSASSSLYIAHSLALLGDFGHPATSATTSMSMMAASTLLGNFAIGAFGEKFGVRRILAGGSITFAIGLVLLGYAHSTVLLYIYPLFLGAGFGAVQVGSMALLSKCVAPARFAAAIGVAISLQTLVSAITPFLGGWIFDMTQTYVPLILTLAALNGLAAIVLLVGARAFPARA